MSIVGDIRSQLVAKLEELQPAFDEYNEAKDALARLDGAAAAARAILSAATANASSTE